METLQLTPVRIKITSILKKAILTGEYTSGQELSLTGIAEQLGCSRTPVREAFQALEAEGLITLRMNKGAIVNQINEKFIDDHFEMREILEAAAAGKAAENGMDTSDLLRRVNAIQDRLATVSQEEYSALNLDIHTSIWRAAGNDRLLHYLEELWNGPSTNATAPEALKHYQDSTKEHLLILKAIQDKNAAEASAIMKQHISRSRANIKAILCKS